MSGDARPGRLIGGCLAVAACGELVIAGMLTTHAGALWPHMLGHALLVVVVGPMLALALPRLPEGPARPSATSVRAAAAWTAFVAAHWVAHQPFALEHGSGWRLPTSILLGLASVVFWMPVLGRGWFLRPLRGPAASLYLFLAMPAVDLVSVELMMRGEPLAAAVMLGAMTPLAGAAAVVTWIWMRDEERSARALEAMT